MVGYWNTQQSPFKDALNNAPKYVVSRTLREPLAWPNSTLLAGEVSRAVADLKAQPGPDLTIMGSGELIQTLIREDLIDEYLLLIHPIVLGGGRRLFETRSAPLHLTHSSATARGMLIATYRRER